MGKAARFLLLLAGRFVGLLDQFSGAAAAYSLRSLSASTTNVVKVRRSSDNAELDFTATEITDGTLLTFVNANVEKVLNGDFSNGSTYWTISNGSVTGGEYVSGALSAYQAGIRQTSFTFTGTGTLTFDLTLNSGSLRVDDGGAVKLATSSGAQSFTLTNPSKLEFNAYNLGFDGIIDNVSFIPTNVDGHVTTWYDQSGNGNNATQATAANQPKIVSSGSLVTKNGKAALDFDGTDDYFVLSNANLAITDYQISSVASDIISGLSPIYCQGSNTNWGDRALIIRENSGILASTDASDTLTVTATFASHSLITYEHESNVANGERVYINGSLDVQVNSVGDVKTSSTAAIGYDYTSQYFGGKIQELIIYNFDQSSNRTGIEDNINDYYNIYP